MRPAPGERPRGASVSTYPIILNSLETRPVWVIGGGKIAEEKVVGLLEAGAANVTVISPDLSDRLRGWEAARRIAWRDRAYRPGEIGAGLPFLVIAATSDPLANHQVAEEARLNRVLVNTVDDPPFCDFYAVSVLRQGRLTVSIGTDGQMPALAARLRQRLSRGFGPEYARLLELAAELRPQIARRFPEFDQRRRVWYALADARLIPMLRRGDSDDAVRAAMLQIVDSFAERLANTVSSSSPSSASSLPPTPDLRPSKPITGTVYLVGAGPGDPELITVRGLRLLQKADAVVYDRLAPPELLDEAPAQALRFDVGKAPGHQGLRMSQEQISQLLVRLAQQGLATIVRLKGGDPYVFGRGGEEALALRAAGVAIAVVPGVTSAVAAPAAAGIPLTYQHLGRSFVVVTGQTRLGQAEALAQENGNGAQDGEPTLEHLSWPALAAIDTVVCLMGVASLPAIVRGLLGAGRDPATPVAIVERGATPQQRVVTGALAQIADLAAAAAIRSPATIVVGNVVALQRALKPAVDQLVESG
jgi:uroporphyrin-III C-methyltransferase/precorrin-2 dehydrogenase/sirohydrochlorin ferrochelatase